MEYRQSFLEGKVVDQSRMRKIQILNCLAFIANMVVSKLSSGPDNKQQFISEEYDLRIQPAGFAFSIWGVIYFLILIFVTYQALPSQWCQSRNDHLIFNEIGYWFAGNMLMSAFWLLIFQQDQKWSFFLSSIDIIGMLLSAIVIMLKAQRS